MTVTSELGRTSREVPVINRDHLQYDSMTPQEQQWARLEQGRFYEFRIPGSTAEVDLRGVDPYQRQSMWRCSRDESTGEVNRNARVIFSYDVGEEDSADINRLQIHINELHPDVIEFLKGKKPETVAEIGTLKNHLESKPGEEAGTVELIADIIQEAYARGVQHILIGLFPGREAAFEGLFRGVLKPAGSEAWGNKVRLGKFKIDFTPFIIDAKAACDRIEEAKGGDGRLSVMALARIAHRVSRESIAS